MDRESPGDVPGRSSSDSARVVLVVDDQPAVRRLVAMTLTAEGCRVLQASDGREAVDICEECQGRLDLIVTDIAMPEMDGIALCRWLSSSHPDIPVLVLSAVADEARVSELAAGVESRSRTIWIQKPFSVNDLLRSIRLLMSVPAGATGDLSTREVLVGN